MTNEIAGTRKHPAIAVERCKQLDGTLIFYNLVVSRYAQAGDVMVTAHPTRLEANPSFIVKRMQVRPLPRRLLN
jgi:hypothetical protein